MGDSKLESWTPGVRTAAGLVAAQKRKPLDSSVFKRFYASVVDSLTTIMGVEEKVCAMIRWPKEIITVTVTSSCHSSFDDIPKTGFNHLMM